MKQSIYNSLIRLSETVSLLYNAFTDKYLVCKNEVVPLLELSAADIAQTNPAFYRNLAEGGFLVDDTLDEAERAVEEGMRRCDNERTYHLVVNPTLNCNFACWYCYENHSAYTKMDGQTVERVRKFIARLCADPKIEHVYLSFFGGEPLLYYNDTVRPLIDCIRQQRAKREFAYSIHFTTNGYLLTDAVLRHLSAGDEPKSFQITLDGGREAHDKIRRSASGAGSYDRILSNLRKLLEGGMGVTLRINFTARNIRSIPSIAADLKDLSADVRRRLSIDFQRVWQDNAIDNDHPQLEEDIEIFRREFPNVVEHYQRIDGFHSPCYGDRLNECVINYNGDVYKCTARDFTSANRAGVLNADGEIEWVQPDFSRRRLQGKFGKPVCRRCRIFPLCGAGCVQTALESPRSCISCKDDREKDQAILTRFYHQIVKPRLAGEHESETKTANPIAENPEMLAAGCTV